MAERAEALVLQMSADIRRMEKALEKISGDTNRHLGATEKRFDKLNQHVQRSGEQMARDLRTAFATIGVTTAIREVAQYADAWTTASNKLAAAGVAQGQLNATMQDLVGLAQSTRSGLEGTVDLYAKLTRAGQQLNLTNSQVRKITETTLQAFVAGGAAASEQAAAITQLSQALGSGVLQGDELRSIRENAPLLAQAIADEFKTTIAGLKELGAQGELTADRVARAILNADGIYDAFSRTVTTLGQAVENLRTEFTRYIAESRIAQTVIGALGGFIQLVTDNIDLLADAAIVAAVAIGGTLAGQAIARFVTSIRTARLEASRAGKEFLVLRTAMSFLGGPIGAIVLGIGVALASMAFSANEAGDAMEQADSAISKLGDAQQAILADTDALAAAQDRLTKAIQANSAATQAAAIADIEAIRKRIQANKDLAITEEVRLREARSGRERQFRANTPMTDEQRKGLSLPILGITANETSPIQELVRQMQQTFQSSGMDSSMEGIRAEIGRRSAAGPLNEQFRTFFWILQQWEDFQADIKSIDDAIGSIGAMKAMGDTGGIDFPTVPESGAGSTQSLSGYRTELERLDDAMKSLRENAAGSDKLFSNMFMALDSLEATTDTNDPNAVSELEKRREAAAAFFDTFNADKLARSREALQALLSFADGAGIKAAFEQLPSLSDILLPDDVALFKAEAAKRVKAVADEMATGYQALVVERDSKIAEINAAMADARAIGVDNVDVYLNAIAKALEDFQADVADMMASAMTLDFSNTGMPDRSFADFMPSVDDINAKNDAAGIAAGLFPSDAQVEFQKLMRDSVKAAMRDGIRTGDWDEAFMSILADAVTSGLDSALNRVGDWLADFLFAPDGFLGSLINGAGAWASSAIFGGARAAGGPVMAGKTYLVGERGPELLTMGGSGNVINASDTNRMLSGMGGGGSIDARVIFSGPIDATNLNEVQRMLDRQRQQIMSSVPTMVRATQTYDRKHRR